MSEATAQHNQYAFISDRTMGAIGVGVVMSCVLDGPLRYALFLVHGNSLLYLRDVAMMLGVLLVMASWWRQRNHAFTVVAVFAILVFHFLIGALTLRSLAQPGFGFKIFVPCLFGVAVSPLIRSRMLLKLSMVTFVLTCAGVILNQWVEYPWIGMSYDTAFGETAGSRLWWQSGATRLPGFARVSFCAASYALFAFVPMYIRFRSPLVRLVLLAATSYTFYLTTTKGVWPGLAAFLVSEVLLVSFHSRRAYATFISLTAIGCLALPAITVTIGTGAGKVPEWATSFMERIEIMWPGAFGLLVEPQQWLWGRGLGGIGVPQGYGDNLPGNAADNLMVYLLVSFGVLGLVYATVLIGRIIVFLRDSDHLSFQTRCLTGWVCAWVGYGYMVNMIEETVLCMILGIALGSPLLSRTALSTASDERDAQLRMHTA